MVNPASQGKKALIGAGDIILDVFRWHSRIECRHDHYGYIDWREEIHRHPDETTRSHHADDETENDDEIGVANSKA